jgi:hypothetical protein
MKTKNFKNTGFGFLDSFKEKNIASIRPSLINNLQEIKYNLSLLINILKKSDNTESITNFLERIKRKINTEDKLLESAYIFGESLLGNSNVFDFVNVEKGESYILFKRIIYNYVEFAKKSEDKKTIELAKRFAKELNI